tara:strand:+ start:166 stop:360 length:195 start_codon:yes stop_codon:yes gene_type:complete
VVLHQQFHQSLQQEVVVEVDILVVQVQQVDQAVVDQIQIVEHLVVQVIPLLYLPHKVMLVELEE